MTNQSDDQAFPPQITVHDIGVGEVAMPPGVNNGKPLKILNVSMTVMLPFDESAATMLAQAMNPSKIFMPPPAFDPKKVNGNG